MEFKGFQWDGGNRDKSRLKHGVLPEEAEQCFLNNPLVTVDTRHSTEHEIRYVLFGESNTGHKLFISFTIRHELVRVISARPMNKKERFFYEKEKEKHT